MNWGRQIHASRYIWYPDQVDTHFWCHTFSEYGQFGIQRTTSSSKVLRPCLLGTEASLPSPFLCLIPSPQWDRMGGGPSGRRGFRWGPSALSWPSGRTSERWTAPSQAGTLLRSWRLLAPWAWTSHPLELWEMKVCFCKPSRLCVWWQFGLRQCSSHRVILASAIPYPK